MKKINLKREELNIILVSYVLTVLFIRGVLYYLYFVSLKGYPVRIITFYGFPFHHYQIGILLILFSAIFYFLEKKQKTIIPPLFLGIGSALFLDEFSFWFLPLFNKYWSIENYLSLISGNLFFLFFYLLAKEETKQKSLAEFPNKNPSQPFFSVVIPAFNEEKFISKTIESLFRQDFKNFEIIIVDNNSTDRTAEIAKKFGTTLIFEKNQGISFARQKGFSAAKGEIIVSTDADTILPEDWLSRIFEEFKNDKNLVAFGGSCLLYSGPISARFASRFFLPLFLIFDRIFSGGWNLMGCNMAIRKEAFLKVGGFNTNLKINEESEISNRLRKIGKVILNPNFKVKTSGRRYKNGLIFGLIYYIPTTFFRWVFRKYDRFQIFPPVREEKSLIGKFSLPIISLFIFLFFIFHLSIPEIVLAKNLVKKDFKRTIFLEREIKNRIKNNFSNIKNAKRNLFDLRRWPK